MPILAYAGSLTRPMPQYGAANGQGITALTFDETTGKLGKLGVTGGIDDTGWLVPDPARGCLYATCEVSGTRESAVAAFRVDRTSAALTLLGQQPTGGNEACHASLSTEGRFLLVANYNGATPEGWPEQSLTVFPVAVDGALGPAVASVRHRGSGPNRERQTTAHAHCVTPSPAGDMLYVTDLGIDRLVAYALGADGSLTPVPTRDFVLPSGLGPRHLVFHPSGQRLFVVSELVPTVLSLATDATTGAVSQIDSFAIKAPDGAPIQPSGIVLTADARHLFVGLRLSQQILGLAIDAAGRLTETGRWASGGATPRDIALSPAGNHLVVANQDSDRLTVFGIDHRAGTLGAPLQHIEIGTPMSIKLASF